MAFFTRVGVQEITPSFAKSLLLHGGPIKYCFCITRIFGPRGIKILSRVAVVLRSMSIGVLGKYTGLARTSEELVHSATTVRADGELQVERRGIIFSVPMIIVIVTFVGEESIDIRADEHVPCHGSIAGVLYSLELVRPRSY